MNKVTRTGTHEIRYEDETGFIVIMHVGTMGPEDVLVMAKAIEDYSKLAPPGDPAYILADNRYATAMSREARQVIAKTGFVSGEAYVVVFGAPFAYRVILNLVFRAVALTTDKMKAIAISEEAEAREWLEDKRRAFIARKTKA